MRFIWQYLKKYRKFIILNLLSVFGFVLIEIGIPTLLATGINQGFNDGDPQYIIKLAGVMLVFALVGLALLILLAYSTNRAVNGIIYDMRMDVFRKVQSFSHDEYEKFGISRLITNTGNDSFQIMQFMMMALRTGLIAPVMFLGSFVMIFRQSPSLAMITLLAIPLMCIAIFFVNKATRPLSLRQQKGLDNINLTMREGLTGLRVIRAFNNEEFQEDRFDKVNDVYATLSKKMFHVVALTSPLFTAVFCVVMVSVISLGSHQVNAAVIEYGTLAAFIEYVFHALFSFLMLAVVFMMYPRMAVASERIEEVLNEPITIENKKDPMTETTTKGIIEFDDVSFAYSDNAQEPVLRNISFTAHPGEIVAFIGSTGSGKSTLIQLLPRFFDITSGSLKIDGVEVRDYDYHVLRNKIGYVPQRAVLFSGTIGENLRFGNPNATIAELEKAANIAQATEFIESHEEGYDYVLAEGGTNLSGGQKQRLCIARALVREPEIYVFDDSFSALDYKTDATLRARLKGETKQSTVLIVAQRVSTIMEADKIIVLNEGRVVGTGTHRELLASCDIYYEIAASQLTEEELQL